MLSSTPTQKFLLDENVKLTLFKLLTEARFDVRLVSKSSSDTKVALVSKTENRALVTNDEDFIYYTGSRVYSVIWLKIPQQDTGALLKSFTKMLKSIKDFSGKLVILKEDDWDISPLGHKAYSKRVNI